MNKTKKKNKSKTKTKSKTKKKKTTNRKPTKSQVKYTLYDRYVIDGMYRDKYPVSKIAKALGRTEKNVHAYIVKHFVTKETLVENARETLGLKVQKQEINNDVFCSYRKRHKSALAQRVKI